MKKKIKRMFLVFGKNKCKVLCSITIVSVLLGMFTVFCSANTVDDEDTGTAPWAQVYFPYPSYKGFSFNFSRSTTFAGDIEGWVYNTSNYMYGLNTSFGDPLSPDFNAVYEEQFVISYPSDYQYGNYSFNDISTTTRLRAYDPSSSSLGYGDVLRWDHQIWSSEVDRYITGNEFVVYYEDFVINRSNYHYFTPLLQVTRYNEYSYAPEYVPYDVFYDFEFIEFNNFTGEAFTKRYSLTAPLTNWKYGANNYLIIRCTPYDWLVDYFAANPNVQSIFVEKCNVSLVCYDNDYPGYFHNINFSNFLFNPGTAEKLKLNVVDYLNQIPEDGYSKLLDSDFTDWISSAVGGFMSFEIFPGFSFQLIFSVLIGALFLFFFLRLFSGG